MNDKKIDEILSCLKNDLQIDKNNLDKELVSQASLFYKYSDLHQELIKNLEQLKAEKDLIYAKLDKDFRKQFSDMGAKFTENTIKSEITLNKDYIQINNDIIDMESLVDRLKVVVQSMDSKRTALDGLVKLYVTGYWQKEGNSNSENAKVNNTDADLYKSLNKKER